MKNVHEAAIKEAALRKTKPDSPISIRKMAGNMGLNPPISLIELFRMIEPEERTFHADVVTPAGTALGGTVDMVLGNNGSYNIYFHMHDSGVPNYDFTVRAIFTTPSGLVLVAAHSGHVEGTDILRPWEEPNRNDDHTDTDTDPRIRMNWADTRNGRLWITKEYSATGVIGFVGDLAKAVLDVVAGGAGAALGVVIGLGAEIGKVFGDLGIGGSFGVIGGVVVFAAGGSIVLATVAGVAIGAVTNEMIQQRPISMEEYGFAAGVFGGSLPPADQIILTNLSGIGGRAFTMPGVDGKIYINFGDVYSNPNPLQYTNKTYPVPGQVLIHELTHAWQIARTSFLPGLLCEGIVNQANNTAGQSVYAYGPPGSPWSSGSFNLEAQGAIVDQWFAGIPTVNTPNRKPRDENDPYFMYIRDNIRQARL